jgi:hypothetical protein
MANTTINKELPHIIQQQVQDHVAGSDPATASLGGIQNSAEMASRLAKMETNLQAVAEKFNAFLKEQANTAAKTKGNQVNWGLKVIALHEMRLMVEMGQATFVEAKDPVNMDYSYLQIAPAGSMRELRYIYLSKDGVLIESATDPTNMGKDYVALALIDVWPDATEITPEQVKDIRVGQVQDVPALTTALAQLQGNASVRVNTGNDSFVITPNNPPDKKVKVTPGRALVDGSLVDAPGGVLDLANVNQVTKEFLGFSDGGRTTYQLFHKNVSDETVLINGQAKLAGTDYTIDSTLGQLVLTCPLVKGDRIEVSYHFTGQFIAVVLVEKVLTEDGYPYGVIGYKTGSNRPDTQGEYQPPQLPQYQHAIGKIDLTTDTQAIVETLIDNSYEIVNLDQETLQKGGKLGGRAIAPNSITTQHITAGGIEASVIKTGTLDASLVAIESRTSGVRIDGTGIHITNGGIEIKNNTGTAIINEEGLSTDALHVNKLVNSSFAIVKDGVCVAWNNTGFQPISYYGESVAKLNSVELASLTQANLQALPNKDYTASCYVKGETDGEGQIEGKVSIRANIYDDLGTLLTTYSTDISPALPSDWERIKVSFNTPPTATRIDFTVEAQSAEIVYIKGCKLEEGTTVTPYTNEDKTLAGIFPIINEWLADQCVTTAKLADGCVTAAKIAPGALKEKIVFKTGEASHGGYIPLPDGYQRSQCKPFVSLQKRWEGWGYQSSSNHSYTWIFVDEKTWQVTAKTKHRADGVVNYLVLGLK